MSHPSATKRVVKLVLLADAGGSSLPRPPKKRPARSGRENFNLCAATAAAIYYDSRMFAGSVPIFQEHE